MESVFLITAVVGAVEFLKRIQARDFFAALTIFVSALIGVLAGFFGAPGVVDVWAGLVLGLGASGLVTTAGKISGYVEPKATRL